MGPVQWVNLLLCGSLTFTSRSKTGTFRAQKQAFIQKKKKKLANFTCVGGGRGGGTTLLEVINTSVETLQVTHGIGSNVSCAVGEFA